MCNRFIHLIVFLFLTCLGHLSVNAIGNPISDELITISIGGHQPKNFNPTTNFLTFQFVYGETQTALTLDFELTEGYRLFNDDTELFSGLSTVDLTSPLRLKLIKEIEIPDSNKGEDGTNEAYSAEDGETPNMQTIEREIFLFAVYGDLPSVFIETPLHRIITSKVEYVEGTEVFVVNSMNDAHYTMTKIKGRGNSSWNMAKKSYTLKLNKKANFAGLKSHKTFAFVANHADKTLIRNSFAYESGREIFTNLKWSPSTVDAHMFMNGSYNGLYNICETVKIDKNRVNIPNIEDCITIDDAPNYGFVLEVNARLDEYFNFTTTRGVCFSLKDPDGEDITEELQEYIRNKVQSVEDALFSADFKDINSPNHYSNYLDTKSFVDWYLVNEIARNNDAIFFSSCNMYYDPNDGKIHMGPLWDFDLAYGNVSYNNSYEPEGFWIKNASWIKRLFSDATFERMVGDRLNEKKIAMYDIIDKIDAKAYEWINEININFQRWPIFGANIYNAPPGYDERLTYQSEIDYMKSFLERRMAWLDTSYLSSDKVIIPDEHNYININISKSEICITGEIKDTEISMFDIFGRTLHRGVANDNNYRISVPSSDSIYIMKIENKAYKIVVR